MSNNVPSSPLVEIFGINSSAPLINFLVLNHGSEYSVQGIAERTKISKAKVSKMKTGLLKYGIIKETRKEGKISYYKFDRNSQYGKIIFELVFTLGFSDKAPVKAPDTASPKPKLREGGDGKIIYA